MTLLIIGISIVLVGMIIGIIWSKHDYYTTPGGGAFLGAAAGATVALLSIALIVLPYTITIGQQPHSQEFELVSAQDSTGVKGSFVWGSGSIGSSLTLNYYVRNGDAKSPRSTYGHPTNIFEVQEGPYRVVEHYTACTDSWLCLYNDTDNWSYDLYVPPGSVVNDFNLDAK